MFHLLTCKIQTRSLLTLPSPARRLPPCLTTPSSLVRARQGRGRVAAAHRSPRRRARSEHPPIPAQPPPAGNLTTRPLCRRSASSHSTIFLCQLTARWRRWQRSALRPIAPPVRSSSALTMPPRRVSKAHVTQSKAATLLTSRSSLADSRNAQLQRTSRHPTLAATSDVGLAQ